MNEVRYAQRVVAERFGSAGRSLLLVNNPGTRGSAPLATATNLRHALAGLARHMDPRTDILFLYLASHGSDDFRLAVRLGDAPINDLGAPELARILAQMPVRRKVVVISACYAGGFIDHLRGPETLVIAAARHDRVSFGCEPDNELTFFGRAFLQDALAHEADIVAAFARATRAVRTLEARRHFEHSEPQIAGGQALRAHLAAIAAGVPATP
ncbi:MAG: C13 family peptidase [Gammaproteobacteria bacterium]